MDKDTHLLAEAYQNFRFKKQPVQEDDNAVNFWNQQTAKMSQPSGTNRHGEVQRPNAENTDRQETIDAIEAIAGTLDLPYNLIKTEVLSKLLMALHKNDEMPDWNTKP